MYYYYYYFRRNSIQGTVEFSTSGTTKTCASIGRVGRSNRQVLSGDRTRLGSKSLHVDPQWGEATQLSRAYLAQMRTSNSNRSKRVGYLNRVFYCFIIDILQNEFISPLKKIKSQKEFYFRIPEGECTELFGALDSQQNLRNHFHVVVVLFKDSSELGSLSSNDIVKYLKKKNKK